MAPSRWTSFLGGGSKESDNSEPLVPDSNAPDDQQTSHISCVLPRCSFVREYTQNRPLYCVSKFGDCPLMSLHWAQYELHKEQDANPSCRLLASAVHLKGFALLASSESGSHTLQYFQREEALPPGPEL